ncbi:MAG TPA: FtsQ-type POTRA domain-containing protein, partial [Mycobacteriales bacterium]|nr:FtsQ-type POTRA domain-containing protein [Mycobacteriales bacterium]
RRRRYRWRAVRPLAVLVVSALLCAFVAWAIWFSGLLAVRRVDVVGSPSDPTADRVAAAGRRALGRPLARVDTAALRRLLEAIPGVASARVRRSWPSTLSLVVTERQALATVSRNGSVWLLDRQGVRFRRVSRAPGGLPRLEPTSSNPNDPATRASLAAVRALPDALRARVRSVSAPTPESVRLVLRDGRTVRWGGADHSGEKARVLQALLHQPGTVYDVSAPSVVAIR